MTHHLKHLFSSGVLISLLSTMQEALNFTVSHIQPPDGFYGAPNYDEETGTTVWNGVVKQVMDGEADITASGLAVSKERESVRANG